MKPEESVDTDARTDKAWLLGVQRTLYQWSRGNPEGAYRELWGWITDIRNLRCAWRTVASNKGKRTPGIDGVAVKHIHMQGVDAYLEGVRKELKDNSYVPSPARRVLIPKRGKPGEFRPLGVPTVRDRIVACAVKQIMEPLFEARFHHVSYGFRPGRSCHGALEHIRVATKSRKKTDGKWRSFPCPWVIEGDIKGCFDHIDHHQVMERIRRRCGDRKVNRLLLLFLKAGVLAEDQFIRTDAGTPQGGILSPLLANVALSIIEERYERWVYQHASKGDGRLAARNARARDRRAGRAAFFPIRYADDFVILVSGTYDDALKEKEALARYLKDAAKLDLSVEKTRITPIEKGFEFLGHRVRVKWDDRRGFSPRIEVPKQKVLDIRYRIKQLTARNTTTWSLAKLIRKLNPILRGWANFYRFCPGAKPILAGLDWYVGGRIRRWMANKHPQARAREIMRSCERIRGRRNWREGKEELFLMGRLKVESYRFRWMRQPDYATISGEPSA
ncbi:MAG: group II intron reverse transcriptase/maturase [Syntrophorhabdales bacterium]